MEANIPVDTSPLVIEIPGDAIYASDVAVLNSEFYVGGGTDDTAALQAVLDAAQDGVTEVFLVMDGIALVTGLKVYSNTTIVGVNGGGFFLKAGSNLPILMGGTPSATVRTEHDILLANLRLNGNGANQTEFNADGTFVTGISFYSVANLTLHGNHIRDTRNWGFAAWNSDGVTILNHTHRVISSRIQQDGIDLRSTTTNAVLRNLDLNCYDDAVALNNIHWGGFGGTYVADGGEISNITIENLYLNNSLFGIDILSDSSLLDGVSISNVTGYTENYWLSITNYDQPGGHGNFGAIAIEDVNTQSYGSIYHGNYHEHVRLHGDIADLSLANCRLSANVDERAYLRVFGGFTVEYFTLADLTLTGLSFTPTPVKAIDGTVTNQVGNGW